MPLLNQRLFLSAAIDSVLGQSHDNLELIVADGGSTDGSLDMLHEHARRDPRLQWSSSPDRGPAEAVNKAARQARGEILGWLNADDLYAGGAVGAAIDALTRNKSLQMVYGQAEFIDENGAAAGRYPTKPPEAGLPAFGDGCFICQPTVFLRKDAWVALGGLDTKLETAFDFDLWIRAFKQWPAGIGFIDRVLARSRQHTKTITSAKRRQVALEALSLLRRHLGLAPAHWLQTHWEEICRAHPDTGGQDLETKLRDVLEEARLLLDEADYATLCHQINNDLRVRLATPELFVGCHPDGWAGQRLEIRFGGNDGRLKQAALAGTTEGNPHHYVILKTRFGPGSATTHVLPGGRRFRLTLPEPPSAEGPCRTLEITTSQLFTAEGDDRKLAFRLIGDIGESSHPLHAPVEFGGCSPTRIYGAMLAIWHLRPALQRRYPLASDPGRQHTRFLAWCFNHGRREYAILRELDRWDEELSRPVALPALPREKAGRPSLSAANFLYGLGRYGGSLSGLLRSSRARRRVFRGFWRGHRHDRSAPPPAAWQVEELAALFGRPEDFAESLRLPALDAKRSREQLAAQFDLGDLEACWPADKEAPPQPAKCAARELDTSLALSPFPLPLALPRWLDPLVGLCRRAPSEQTRAAVTSRIPYEPRPFKVFGERAAFGVNLIGYARGELGIGEDIRQVALALEAAGIPVCILDFAPGKNISQAEDGAAHFLAGSPRYGINLFCLTGIETTRYVCEQGLSTLEGRYNIGLWPWELADWPESCRHAYACVDEIWGISDFTARAYRAAAPRPVQTMGLPVELGPIGPETRRDFGLPEDDYLYYFAFDINSGAARKNPEGLIAAFQKAFPSGGREKVGLVLKISHPETRCKVWRRIRRTARRDPRIHLMEKTLRRPQLLALFRACDCFVSLHRAEGFGRGLAEALLLGKQVVTTGYSGNVDFCREPRVALVRHRMVPLREGEYAWGAGQSWAEPDLEHAAELMRSVRAEPRPCDGTVFPFDPATVGSRYAARLREIWRHHHGDNQHTVTLREHPGL